MKVNIKNVLDTPLIKKIAGNKILLLVAMVFSVLNATLRITESGMTSVYRLMSPFLFLAVFFVFWTQLKQEIVVVLAGIVYGVIVSVLFYGHVSFDMWVFLAYLCILFVLVRAFFFTSSDFAAEFFRFLNIVTLITLVLCWIQYFIREPYPFLVLPRDPGVNVFMSNENELAAPLACMFVVYLYKVLFEKKWGYLPVAINIAFFVYINDAKLSIIGMTVAVAVFAMFGLYFLLNKKFNISARKFIPALIVIGIVTLALIVILDPEIKFRDYNISIRSLILDEIMDIITLNPTLDAGGGSLIDRTNAIIFGLTELKKTCFFGIGWGNSIVMLEKPEYLLVTAKSMHNIIFQFFVEFGFFAIICYIAIVIWLVRCIKNVRKERLNIVKVAFAVSFVFTSSQSSVGILSNYYTWLVVFWVALAGKKVSAEDTQDSLTLIGTAKTILSEIKCFVKKCITW